MLHLDSKTVSIEIRIYNINTTSLSLTQSSATNHGTAFYMPLHLPFLGAAHHYRQYASSGAAKAGFLGFFLFGVSLLLGFWWNKGSHVLFCFNSRVDNEVFFSHFDLFCLRLTARVLKNLYLLSLVIDIRAPACHFVVFASLCLDN